MVWKLGVFTTEVGQAGFSAMISRKRSSGQMMIYLVCDVGVGVAAESEVFTPTAGTPARR
jgi:hypothetical protein